MPAIRRRARCNDGVELLCGLIAAFEVREYATAGEVRAQRDRGVCVGRRKEYRLSEVRERLVETLGLQVFVEGVLRREACGLSEFKIDERLLAVLFVQRREPRLGFLVVVHAQKGVNVAQTLEQ